MFTPREKAERYFTSALEAAAETYPTKSAQKDAISLNNRAYEYARDAAREQMIRFANDNSLRGDARYQFLDENDMPFDLHKVRDRHVEIARKWDARMADIIEAARTLREHIKAAPVIRPQKAESQTKAAEEKIQRSVRSEMERLNKMYENALELGRLFNGLPVTANVHLVTNRFGTTFLRAFYYLDGKLAPLGLIIAAAQELEGERKAAK